MLATHEALTLAILEATTAAQCNSLGWDLTHASNKKEISIDRYLLLRQALGDKRQELGLYR